MELSKQVVSLELAKKLKELGFILDGELDKYFEERAGKWKKLEKH